MRKILPVIAVLVFVGIIAVSWYVKGYNKVVKLNENVKNSWSQVDTQLKRRYDLIPNLVETVKGYASHEREVFEKLAEARRDILAQEQLRIRQRLQHRSKVFFPACLHSEKHTRISRQMNHFLSYRIHWKVLKTGFP